MHRVKKDQLLAQIFPALYTATLKHEQAALAHSRADLVRVKALLEQAVRTEKRARNSSPPTPSRKPISISA